MGSPTCRACEVGSRHSRLLYDRFGNLIAETAGGGATGSTGTVREYIYLPETEISPTFGSRTVVDRPLAVVNAVNTTPVIWAVHVDHLNRPIQMTDSTKAAVWTAQWLPWGNVFAITGTAVLDARFPGQWFQLESGLHYNWYRAYDPTIGRFTQPDPLGFVDGPSQYAYGRSSPARFVDRDGRFVQFIPPIVAIAARYVLQQTGRWALGKIVDAIINGIDPTLGQRWDNGNDFSIPDYVRNDPAWSTIPDEPDQGADCGAVRNYCEKACVYFVMQLQYEFSPGKSKGKCRDRSDDLSYCKRRCQAAYQCR